MKKFWFRVLAVFLPFVGLAVLEVALRAAGVGAEEQAVFVPVEGHEAYQTLNPDYLRRYFNGAFEPEVAYHPFLKEKPEGAFRVMVLGGSSTAGFPYRFYLGFPTQIEQRLEAEAVGQKIEVINLGVTAANSYTIWDLKDEIVAQQPDAVVIYAGHNEYYGAFGAGSSVNALGNRIRLKRLVLRLKDLVLYRRLEDLIRSLAPKGGDGRSLMAQMIRDAEITLDGDAYRDGIAQFEANMREALATFRDAGIPVYMGTLVSNLKDQPPLGDDPEALADYEQGQELLERGDTTQARVAFLSAKDRDEIRFRAPEALNALIDTFAEEGLVTEVDLAPVARAYSFSGIEDEWFFADHLHPNVIGYNAFGERFFEALKSHPALRLSGVALLEEPVDENLDWRMRYVTLDRRLADPFERLFAHLQVFSINAGYPFNKRSVEEEQILLEQMLGRVRASRSYLDYLTYETLVNDLAPEEAIALALPVARARGDTLYALQMYRSSLYWRPFDEDLRREAVAFATRAAEANPRYQPTAEQILFHVVNLTGDAESLNALAALRLKRGAVEDAATLLALAEAAGPGPEAARQGTIRLVAREGSGSEHP
ncbi:SGNH/GDSL hydrolase family protein [Rhodocaloribacter sp.]